VASGRDCASLKFVVLYLSLSRWTGRRFLFARLPQANRYAQAKNEDCTMKILADKLLEVILLLTGLYVVQSIIFFLAPLAPIDDLNLRIAFITNAPWIGNIIFGLVVLSLTKDKKFAAIPVGFLSVVLPSYGLIFYILTTLQIKQKND
jgi:hypothetical protein